MATGKCYSPRVDWNPEVSHLTTVPATSTTSTNQSDMPHTTVNMSAYMHAAATAAGARHILWC